MFGIDVSILAVILLAGISAAGLAYVILFPKIEAEKKAETRFRKVKASESDRTKVKAARDRMAEMSKRRKSVQDSLKDFEKKQEERNTKPSMKVRLTQAGLRISPTQLHIYSTFFAILAGTVVFILTANLFAMVGVIIVCALGLPRWVVSFLTKRRCEKFLEEFPNALDTMVRSIKSGLPLADAMRLIASDGQEPVKSEFRRVIDSQGVGLSIAEACGRMIATVPRPEVNFFAIVIAIQSQSGGNLSEAIGNLSKVLRDRRKMKAKIKALSMEAKASAWIIGALPFIVATLVYLTSPDYMMVLFTDPRGHMIMAISAVVMAVGVFVMRQMINFDI